MDEEKLPQHYITNNLDLVVRKFIHKYYEAWLVCEEQSCKTRTRQLYFKKGPRCIVPGCKGLMHQEYSEDQLYNQIMYLLSIFDPIYTPELYTHVESLVNKNARRYVNLSKLFAVFHKTTTVK